MCSVALACIAGVKRGGGVGEEEENSGKICIYTPVTQAILPYGFNIRNVGCGTLERKQRA